MSYWDASVGEYYILLEEGASLHQIHIYHYRYKCIYVSWWEEKFCCSNTSKFFLLHLIFMTENFQRIYHPK